MDFRRYAVFVTPPPGPLAAASAAWLGWDAAAGVDVPHPEIKGLPRPIAEITSAPRKYGFHGTIKPPFRLAPGADAADLRVALRRLCADLAPVRLDGLAVAPMGRFLALRPVGDHTALADLAAQIVAGLDGFRAPPDEAELARRRGAGLSPVQEALLARWGYPYVMDQLRYHMTLTGPLAPAERPRIEAALAAYLGPHLPAPHDIVDLTLLGEGADGRLRHVVRVPFGARSHHVV